MGARGRKSAASLSVVGFQPATHHPRPPAGPPAPPEHLGAPERQIWNDVLRDYELTARVSLAVLSTSLEAHQRAREARETIAREGMTIIGRDGQVKVHPLLAVERDARQAWLAGIRTLGLEL
jgi:P27 family predicted phage terminase small subunit